MNVNEGGGGGRAPLIFNLSSSSQIHATVALPTAYAEDFSFAFSPL